MPYLLDSDVFIQAKNLHYSFDFCPAFWDWIEAVVALCQFRKQPIGRSEVIAELSRAPPVAPAEEGILPVTGVVDVPKLILHLLYSQQRLFGTAGVA
jgi:hypothetical protein